VSLVDRQIMSQPIIEAAGITQGYGRHVVLDGLHLTITGGCVAFLGPNAAGKTTLLRTLATAVRPTGGELRLFGTSPGKATDLRMIRRRIGFVPQHAAYPSGFTVDDVISYAAWLREIPAKETEPAVIRARQMCDLDEFRSHRMRALSGGTARRVILAQALVHRPELLLMDEPVAALDLAQRRHFYRVLQEVRNDTTVVLTTHLVDETADLCDRFLFMVEGRLVDEIDRAELNRAAAGPADARAALERRYLSVTGGVR
jgi:ABC-2 type transport system ATP-binding protein